MRSGALPGELDAVEGQGAANFLTIDDLTAVDEREQLNSASVIALPVDVDLPRLPQVSAASDDPFLWKVHASREKWTVLTVLTDLEGQPRLALDADGHLHSALFDRDQAFNPYAYCHRLVVVSDLSTSLGWVIQQIARGQNRSPNGVIEKDVVLVWGPNPRILTGADILSRLLEGI